MKSLLSKLAIIAIICTTSISALAQNGANGRKNCPNQKQYYKQICEKRNNFIVKTLSLTEEQKTAFLPMYNQMKKEISDLHKQVKTEVREIAKSTEDISNSEYTKVTEAMIEVNAKASAIELDYYTTKFAKELSPEQLFKLKKSEENFMRKMLNDHKRGGKKGNGNRKPQQVGNKK